MTAKIQILEDDVINKIAAGEVVERPASVVKELVENSLDAGSTKIVVSIKDGGKKLIQVTDNGHGMSADQLRLSVARHATSKIQVFDDLSHLKTNGFRGEALASICSVTKVVLSSKACDHDASEILIEGGEVLDQRACAQPQGTTVAVKYLFYQTPARLKFLKTSATETSHVVDTMTKLALCHPDLAFKLLNHDKALIDVPAGQTLKERTVALLGKDISEYLYEFEAEVPGMKMFGFLSHPQISRSQRSHAYFFVNNRPVTDKVIWHAVLESYRDLLMKGKFPVMVLNLMLDENTVDINVHPQKSEIRFHHSSQVHHFVYQTLRQKLKESPWLERGRLTETSETSFVRSQDALQAVSQTVAESQTQSSSPVVQEALKNWSERYFQNQAPVEKSYNSPSQEVNKAAYDESQHQIKFGRTAYANMNPIGQLLGTYILCESDSELILIDQHAAHERVGFEKLCKQYNENGIAMQPMLIPETFDLKPSDADIFKNYLAELEKFGFEIEFFGGQTFVLKGVPALLQNKIDMSQLVPNIVEDIKETGEMVSLKDKLHHVFATMACHAQIRANHHLTTEEISALLKELDAYQFTDFCPHGRPVSIKVSLQDIEKWFRRI